ncbi:hypothetical protein MKW94_000318 [Papaver nudicaule]|uniref:Uncharacterized protein n=1 Tax=Papaver nudicaule TaxID=74823 RepID=A0AA41S795_PAPNU|nr:hypothetical protein [Papaver nudicaule]
MDVHQFVSAARSYWVFEVTCLGMNVLEKLNALHQFYVENSISMLSQATTSLHMLEVIKGLMEPKVLDWKAPKALLEYTASSRQRIFESACPPDSKMGFSEDMIKLRKSEFCMEIIKEIMMEIFSSDKKLSLGQIWKVVMLIFVYGSLPVELYQVIANRSDLSRHWKSFFEQFKDSIDSGIVRSSFLLQIKNSLGKTFFPNLRKLSSYISPFHFTYLLERFLYLASSWKSTFFMTKSSLLETLTCENFKLNSISELGTDTSLKAELSSLEVFLLGFGHDILSRKKDTLEWLKKTDGAAKKAYSSLVLRLFIYVCLVCINAENHSDLLCELLVKDDISSFLPVVFRDILDLARPLRYSFGGVSMKVDYNRLSKAFAKVLKIIENPLVVLYIGGRPTFSCVDAIFVDMELILCREDLLNVLYLKGTECVQQDSVIEFETKHLGDENVSSCIIESNIHSSQPSSSFIEEEQVMENGHEDICDLQGGYKTVWHGCDLSSLDKSAMKFNTELLIRVLDAEITKLNLNATSGTEDLKFVIEAENTIDKLKQFLIAHAFKIWHAY